MFKPRLFTLILSAAVLTGCVMTSFQQRVTATMDTPDAALKAELVALADRVAAKYQLRPDPAQQGENVRGYLGRGNHTYRLTFTDQPDGNVKVVYAHDATQAKRGRLQPERAFYRALENKFGSRLRNIIGPDGRPPRGKTDPEEPS